MQLIRGVRDMQFLVAWLRDPKTSEEHARRAKLREALAEPLWQRWGVPNAVLDAVLGIAPTPRRVESPTPTAATPTPAPTRQRAPTPAMGWPVSR